jgi:hypothetical protein
MTVGNMLHAMADAAVAEKGDDGRTPAMSARAGV